jgi:HAD superfamily hydrolase (TIGR01549 family)
MRADQTITAVTFDYWQTLLWEEPGGLQSGRVAAWAGLFEEAGIAIPAAVLDQAHASAFELASASWRAGRQYTAEHAGRQVLEHLGVSVPPDVAEAVIKAFSSAGRRTVLHVTEGLQEMLRRLRDRGLKIGIVCDVGLTPSPVLRDHLEERGLLRYFDGWAFSDEVGYYKPRAEPFRHVLAALGVDDPATAVHTGDNRRTDVAGARAMGMTSVRYTGVFDDQSEHAEADLVVASHAEMLEQLGL